MGAWGTGSFENDDAKECLAGLAAMGPKDLIQGFVRAGDESAYLEAPAASAVVVAAEVIATLIGFPPANLPPEIATWTANRQPPTLQVKALALRALERIRKNSELKDLWLEADGLNDWIAAIQDLQTRVAS
jgi:hypothetical protein